MFFLVLINLIHHREREIKKSLFVEYFSFATNANQGSLYLTLKLLFNEISFLGRLNYK